MEAVSSSEAAADGTAPLLVDRRLRRARRTSPALVGSRQQAPHHQAWTMNDIQLAKFLGWFSIALGALELVAPGRLASALGLRRSGALVRGLGAREVAAGVAALAYPDSPAPPWARVAGDALDLAVLRSVLRPGNPRREKASAATAAVLAVMAIDVICAVALTRRQARVAETGRRTRISARA
jgi:hypothetical protein